MNRKGIRIVVMLVCGLSFGVSVASAADYFTELEIDRIRETQEVERRISLFLEIARIRLGHLGLTEEFKDLESEEDSGGFSRTLLKILQPGISDETDRPVQETEDFENDLAAFTSAELLRGYSQALEEAMDNIDDVYERRRGSVREPLELLMDFTEETIPMLERHDPATEDEQIALGEAIEQAQLALDGAEKALEIVPKTERK